MKSSEILDSISIGITLLFSPRLLSIYTKILPHIFRTQLNLSFPDFRQCNQTGGATRQAVQPDRQCNQTGSVLRCISWSTQHPTPQFWSRALSWALSLDNIFTATHTYPQTSKKQSKFPLLFNHQLATHVPSTKIEVSCLALKLLAW